jgi:hypothetical protein
MGSPPFSQTRKTPALVFENSRFPSLSRPKPDLLPHFFFPYRTQPPEQPHHNTSLSSLSSPRPKRPANHGRLSIFPDLFISNLKEATSSVFFPFGFLNSNGHGQAAARPATAVPFPSSDAPFSFIPPCRRPPETEKKVKQRKNRSIEETNIKKGKTESRSEKERNGLKSTACVFFLVTGHDESHRRQESEEEKKLSQIHLFTGSGAWMRRAATVLALPEVFLCNSSIFGGLFCNF